MAPLAARIEDAFENTGADQCQQAQEDELPGREAGHFVRDTAGKAAYAGPDALEDFLVHNLALRIPMIFAVRPSLSQ